MSKALYDEVHAFLADKWGPMGGWAQAVMFAVDLPVGREGLGQGGSTPSKSKGKSGGTGGTPRTPMTPKTPKTPKTPGTPITPKRVKGPKALKGSRMGEGTPSNVGSVSRGVKVEPEGDGEEGGSTTPTRRAKRKVAMTSLGETPNGVITDGMELDGENGTSRSSTFTTSTPSTPSALSGSHADATHPAPMGLPAGYGFKRTRSAARIELQRQSSGVSVLAKDIEGMGV